MGDADNLELGTMNPLDGLLDELLVEILCRLPCSKSAVHCKCVCKRWLALISHPYFTSFFVVHKTQQQANNVPFSIVYGPRTRNFFFAPKGITNKGILLYTDEEEPSSGSRGGYTVNYPPWCEPDGEVSMCVYGACYDLLLCCRNPARSRDYCLYNPRTRQYLQLPDPPRRQQPVTVGLVCDPYYSPVDEGPLVLDASYKFYAACFRILRKRQSSNQVKLKMDIFSSEIWGWRKMVLYSPKPFLLHTCHNMVFVYGGMLYTYSISGILGFDPRESDHEGVSVIRGHFIDWPDGRVNGYPSIIVDCFTIADARLLFSHCDTAGKLSVWQLEDQDKWSLKYKLCLKELVSCNSTLCNYAESPQKKIWLFGVHPFCKDVIYLRLDYHIVLCNLREKVLKIVSRAPRDRICSDYFWLVYPWWPTPMRTTCRGLSLSRRSDAVSE